MILPFELAAERIYTAALKSYANECRVLQNCEILEGIRALPRILASEHRQTPDGDAKPKPDDFKRPMITFLGQSFRLVDGRATARMEVAIRSVIYDIDPEAYGAHLQHLRSFVDPCNAEKLLPQFSAVADWRVTGHSYADNVADWINAFDGAAWRSSIVLEVGGGNNR